MYLSLKPVLKDLMKRQGITYKDMSRHLGMSESGVKKLFQATDCSLSRLEQMSQLLGSDLGTLILKAQNADELQQFEIDPKAQNFLVKSPLALDIYWLLLIEELNPPEILTQYKISKTALYKCLAELEKLKLIEWKMNDRVHLSTRHKAFLLKPGGPILKIWMQQFSDSVLNDVNDQDAGKKSTDPVMMLQRFLRLKPNSILEFRRRLHDLVSEYTLLSVKERRLGREKTKSVRVLAGLAMGSMFR